MSGQGRDHQGRDTLSVCVLVESDAALPEVFRSWERAADAPRFVIPKADGWRPDGGRFPQ